MEQIFCFLGDFQDVRNGAADSFCDRLSSITTVFLLSCFAILISTKHLVGEPLACWCPSHFKKDQVEYTNRACWTTNTYYLPFEVEEIPKEGEWKKMINYYQWVALILASQAVMFYLPRLVWRMFNTKSGIAVNTITDAAMECQRKMDFESRDKTMRYMVKHMGRFLLDLSRNQMMANRCKRFWYKFYGNYLIIIYIFVKIIYITNVIGQVFLLNLFLGTDYHMYGFNVMKRMLQGEDWSTSDRFPRVTLCDLKLRVLGNLHHYTVQCTLPLNLFNEKIFIFVWFWFVFVAFASTFSLFSWIGSLIYLPYQITYIRHRLIAEDKIRNGSDKMVNRFVLNYLRRDGLFIIKLVANNASDIVAAELIAGLFEYFKDHKRQLERLESQSENFDNQIIDPL